MSSKKTSNVYILFDTNLVKEIYDNTDLERLREIHGDPEINFEELPEENKMGLYGVQLSNRKIRKSKLAYLKNYIQNGSVTIPAMDRTFLLMFMTIEVEDSVARLIAHEDRFIKFLKTKRMQFFLERMQNQMANLSSEDNEM